MQLLALFLSLVLRLVNPVAGDGTPPPPPDGGGVAVAHGDGTPPPPPDGGAGL